MRALHLPVWCLSLMLLAVAPDLALSATPLPSHHPKIEYQEEPFRFGFDATLIAAPQATPIARFFLERFKEDVPVVYPVPGWSNLFLVSSWGKLARQDTGRRFFLVARSGEALKICAESQGAGDSYILQPSFFTAADKILLVAEEGAEYTWGHTVFLLDPAASTLTLLGPLNIAGPPREEFEGFITPIPEARTYLEQNRFVIEIPTDVVLRPGEQDEVLLRAGERPFRFVQGPRGFELEH